ncbi:MAG: hypothetical protein JXB38_16080, partial [Anaerolineales bacterium]|nr:hypothetical protein [Anaerolineales bacterium]
YRVAAGGEFIVVFGRAGQSANQVERLDVLTGEVNTLWTLPQGEQFDSTQAPSLSPDAEQLIVPIRTQAGEKVLVVLDLNGQEEQRIPNGQLLNWRPGGGAVILETVPGSGEPYQLGYFQLDGSPGQYPLEPSAALTDAASWSSNGEYLAFNRRDLTGTNELYLWWTQTDEPVLLSTAPNHRFGQLTWTSDSLSFYVNVLDRRSGKLAQIWQYLVTTGEIRFIAPIYFEE